ncbi:MAG: LysM peptidoglycan-binding domain-containing protein, partial [Bacteroidota bacterium]
KGENLFRIAKQYGVTTDDLSTWNNLAKNAGVIECQELVVSASLVNPEPDTPAQYTSTTGSWSAKAKKQAGDWHTVRAGETVASIANTYGYTEEKFRAFNNLSEATALNPGSVVRSTECSCITAAAPAPAPTTFSNTNLIARSPAPATSASVNRGYMTLDESAMIDEINKMRANPRAYVTDVRAAIADVQATMGRTYPSRDVNSLITRLQSTPALSQLQAHPCLYQVAKNQGQYLKNSGRFQHTDAFGVGPWSRTMNACPQVKLGTTKGPDGMIIGSENLVAGMANARNSLVELLVDANLKVPGHRETLLAPEWRYVASYNFGTIGGMPNHWVQNFGR